MLALLGLLPQIVGLGNSITELFKQKEKSKSDKELKQIDAEIESIRDKRAVLIAEAGHSVSATLNSGIRLFLALPAAFILWKLMVWDKIGSSFAGCVKQFSTQPGCEVFYTDPLDVNQWAVITAVIGFYFLYDIFKRK